MASRWFANGAKAVMDGTTQLDASKLKAVLINSTGNANLQFDTEANLNEIVAGDRADAVFQNVSTSAGSIVGASDHVRYGSGSQVLTFTTVATGQKCKGIVVFVSSTTTTVSRLLCFNSFTAAADSNGGNITVTLSANGWGQADYS